MSELRADTITAANGTGPVTLTKQAGIKAFSEQDNDSPNPANKSLNQSSITDSDTGHKIHNWTSHFSDTVYLGLSSVTGNRGSTTGTVRTVMPDGAWTTIAADVRYAFAPATATDDAQAGLAVLGDLA